MEDDVDVARYGSSGLGWQPTTRNAAANASSRVVQPDRRRVSDDQPARRHAIFGRKDPHSATERGSVDPRPEATPADVGDRAKIVEACFRIVGVVHEHRSPAETAAGNRSI